MGGHAALAAAGAPLVPVGEAMAVPEQCMHILDTRAQHFLNGPVQVMLHNEITRVGGVAHGARSSVPIAPTKSSLQQLLAPSAKNLATMPACVPSHARTAEFERLPPVPAQQVRDAWARLAVRTIVTEGSAPRFLTRASRSSSGFIWS